MIYNYIFLDFHLILPMLLCCSCPLLFLQIVVNFPIQAISHLVVVVAAAVHQVVVEVVVEVVVLQWVALWVLGDSLLVVCQNSGLLGKEVGTFPLYKLFCCFTKLKNAEHAYNYKSILLTLIQFTILIS